MIEATDVHEFMEKLAAKNIILNKHFGAGTQREVMKKILAHPYISTSTKKKLFETGIRNNPYASGYMDNRVLKIGDEFNKLSPGQQLVAKKLNDLRSVRETLTSEKPVNWNRLYNSASGKYIPGEGIVDAQDIAKAKLYGPTAFYEAYDDVKPLYEKRLKNLLRTIKNQKGKSGAEILSEHIQAKDSAAPFFSSRSAYDPGDFPISNLGLGKMTNVRMLEPGGLYPRFSPIDSSDILSRHQESPWWDVGPGHPLYV